MHGNACFCLSRMLQARRMPGATLSAMMLADVTVALLAAPSIMTPFMRCTIRLLPFSIVGRVSLL